MLQQKLAKRDNARIDRNQDIEQLWEFYKLYKRRHRVDDIQRQEQNLRESGTFSTNLGEYGQLALLILIVILVVCFCTAIFLVSSSKLIRLCFLPLYFYNKYCALELRPQSTFTIFNTLLDARIPIS